MTQAPNEESIVHEYDELRGIGGLTQERRAGRVMWMTPPAASGRHRCGYLL